MQGFIYILIWALKMHKTTELMIEKGTLRSMPRKENFLARLKQQPWFYCWCSDRFRDSKVSECKDIEHVRSGLTMAVV